MDVLCIGEALIDFVSRERGQTLVTASQYTAATGGAPANVAAGLARLGRHARLIATVGDDAFGRKIAYDLEAAGVDCVLRLDPDHFTTLAFVKQGAEGDRDLNSIRAHTIICCPIKLSLKMCRRRLSSITDRSACARRSPARRP